MNDESIRAIVAEIAPLLAGRAPGKIFQLSPESLAIDFRLRDGYLFITAEPGLPRIYLIKRRVRDLEKQSLQANQFALTLRKELSGTALHSIEKDARDRIVRFGFVGKDDLDQPKEHTLVAQLTGRSANLFLLDAHGSITHQLRSARGSGQQIGEEYRSPGGGRSTSPTPGTTTGQNSWGETVREGSLVRDGATVKPLTLLRASTSDSLSEALDVHYNALLNERAFDTKVSSIRTQLQRKLARAGKLLKTLQANLASHADAEQEKSLGDLLLANLSTASRKGNRIKLIDYFSTDAPVIEIEVDEKLTLPQEAERRFALYSRSKRAVRQINSRIAVVQREMAALDAQLAELEKLIAERDEPALDTFMSGLAAAGQLAGSSPTVKEGVVSFSISRGKTNRIPGVRRYVSSDGFEILVGRTSSDNDHLTFKVARPNDLWLHAADYGGSHVVVRNPTRKDVAHRTLIEAAQLAAKFSQARKNPKVDVHYTERKFVSKMKGGAPGLVRLSRFKTIIVEPKEGVERL